MLCQQKLNISGFLKKTLSGGFGSVSTRLSFDSQILLSNKGSEKLVFDFKINEKQQTERINKATENGRKQSIWVINDQALALWLYQKYTSHPF